MNKDRFSTLISTSQLHRILDDPDLRLFDCRFYLTEPDRGQQAYRQGHIPNSQYADLDQQLAGAITPTTGRHPLPDRQVFENQLRQWGVNENSRVVVYDDAGGAIAARLWWMCRWAGLDHVVLLDGGLQAWTGQEFELTAREPVIHPGGYRAVFDDSLWISTDDLAARAGQPQVLLTDARAAPRYRGEVEPIDPVAGHVPGARNFPFDGNLCESGQFLDPAELASRHQDAPETREVYAMCGSGVTACHNLLARAHAGLEMGKLYVGSWSEWITDPQRPVACGEN